MRVSFLINSLWGGGAEKQLSLILNYLPYEKVYTLEKAMASNEKIAELSTHNSSTANFIKILSLGYYKKKFLSALSDKRQTVISFMTRANAVNVEAASISGHTAIVCERTNPNQEFFGFRRKIYFPILRKTYAKAKKVITNSNGCAQEIISNFSVSKEKLIVIPNMVDFENVRNLAKEDLGQWKEIFQSPVILNCARLTDAKGQWRLLRIFACLKKKNKAIKLVFTGDGELRNYLQDLSNALGLKTFSAGRDRIGNDFDVYFTGYIKNPHKFAASCCVFILSSLWEGSPNAVLEAMACGAACISSNCQYGPLELFLAKPDLSFYSASDIIEGDFGVLLPALNREKVYKVNESLDETENVWVDYISSFIRDAKKLSFYRNSALSRSLDHTPEKIIPLWKKLYE